VDTIPGAPRGRCHSSSDKGSYLGAEGGGGTELAGGAAVVLGGGKADIFDPPAAVVMVKLGDTVTGVLTADDEGVGAGDA